MELIKIITFLCLFFSSLLVESHPSFHHQDQQLSLPILHRKIMFTEKVKESDEARHLVSHKRKDSLPAGKQNMEVGSKGTRQEWMESDDPSQYFTMDYNRVKRRRPIHNKQLPVGP
ncbi:hypothetical protein MtrunA17_Chr5g0420511 [Medicago truncatula]|uniref:Transmembrane protein n=1 Tax=Medicago truncatula TaxID=3880 RepID=G7JZ91_MEDTR|nr:probable root meristem growth factor 8 [Medicago truncatula]AES97276.1 hypothetical protein MTR_5g048090 [Medicago truncatula]RHN55675.1 hypothetical protein MtrunA17_Chr5g0420511 [Medicago truncatula]